VSGQGIGARLPRKEDDRYLRGEGQFVGDFRLPRMHDVAFLRSPVAHARIKLIRIPPALRHHVFIAIDLVGVRAIRADTALPGFKSSLQPVLATEKVRHVGEPIAMCVALTTAEAEDMVAMIDVDFDTLPPVQDMMAARQNGSSLVHEPWGDNIFLTTDTDVDFAGVCK
jgi:carbon-monoxide dehydrogenase large subunit